MFNTFHRFGLGAPTFFFAADDTSGGAATGSEGDGNPTQTKGKRKRNIDLAAESVWLGLVDEHGSEAAAGRYLVKRNHSFEEAKNNAEDELATLKAQKPDENAQKLTDSERAELDAYRALNGKPEELKTELDAGRVSRRNEEVADFATVLKLKNNALLKSLIGDAKFEYEGTGEERKVKSIKGNDGKAFSYEDFIKARPDFAEALPSLQTGAQDGQQQNGQQRGGGAWIAQGQQNGGTANGQQQPVQKPASYTM